MRWEAGYLGLSAIDAVETIDCMHRVGCSEGNPIFGKHPSTGAVIAAKLGVGLIHFVLVDRLNRQNSRYALRVAQISCALQGGVVLLNAKFGF